MVTKITNLEDLKLFIGTILTTSVDRLAKNLKSEEDYKDFVESGTMQSLIDSSVSELDKMSEEVQLRYLKINQRIPEEYLIKMQLDDSNLTYAEVSQHFEILEDEEYYYRVSMNISREAEKIIRGINN